MKPLPFILSETDDWAVVIKDHGMPTAPLKEGEQGTLLSWFLEHYPSCSAVYGKKNIERGLLHRLDTDTSGCVLIAKNQSAYDYLVQAQDKGQFIKRYRALCNAQPLPGFPRSPVQIPQGSSLNLAITSLFRPWGPGRKAVRPVFTKDCRGECSSKVYTTLLESLEKTHTGNDESFLAQCVLTHGFRHQIRCHLASIGYPISGDRLYNDKPGDGPLCLWAYELTFPDPTTEKKVCVSFQLPDKMSQ